MTKIDVFCAIPGAANGFRIKIEHDATVGELQEAIYTYKRYKERFPDRDAFAADEMTLFLAKEKDGGWVAHDKTLQARLQDEIDVAKFTFMSYGDMLSDYFGTEMQLPRRVIHVLVMLPSASSGNNAHQPQSSRKRKYTFSTIGPAYKSLLEHLDAELIEVDTVQCVVDESAEPFQWAVVEHEEEEDEEDEDEGVDEDEDEDVDEDERDEEQTRKQEKKSHKKVSLYEVQQREAYLKYMERNLKETLEENALCVKRAESGQVNVKATIGDVELSGYPDLLILSDVAAEDKSALRDMKGVRMLIEVKRSVAKEDEYQGLSQLIGLDIAVHETVMALLTDLNKFWRFSWVKDARHSTAKNTICQATLRDPKAAFHAIKTLLNQLPQAGEQVDLPCFQESVKRTKLIHQKTCDSNQGRSVVEWYRFCKRDDLTIEAALAVTNTAVRSFHRGCCQLRFVSKIHHRFEYRFEVASFSASFDLVQKR